MPEYLSPGVYVEEIEIGARPIEGVSTSTAGFLGETLRGPLYPRLVTGFEQFRRIYGGYFGVNKFLPFAVEGFFSNGGQRCFIARIVGEAPTPLPAGAKSDGIAVFPSTPAPNAVTFKAVGPGVWGNNIAVKIDKGSLGDTRKLTVMYWTTTPPTPLVDPTDPKEITNSNRREPELLEVYDNLVSDPNSIDYWEKRINLVSNLIFVDFPEGQPNPTVATLTRLAGGVDLTTPDLKHYQGLQAAPTPVPAPAPGTPPPAPVDRDVQLPDGTTRLKTGLRGFEQIDEISLVIAPDHHDVVALDNELITHCTRMRDRFAILHATKGTQPDASTVRPGFDTTYAAFYFPWIKIFDPRTSRDILAPPSGHVAGIYANTDIERGVHKAPANAPVLGARGLEVQITKGEQDVLNPKGVNCIRAFPSRGIRVWGARTLSTNSLWKYINVRRLFLFLAESIDEGTQWVVFEPNNEKLWARVIQTITQFLITVWRTGALMGLTQEEAFFVKCDRTTMTQDDIDNGRLICIIGVAPTKPAEFVIFRIAQFTGGSDLAEI